MLIESSSIAIWNRNKVVMAIAIVVWGTNVAFLIEGRSLPLPLLQVTWNYTRCFSTGAARVGHELQ